MTVALAACGQAGAAAYRCDDAGKITYSDLPCVAGTQTSMRAPPPEPSDADRAAAASRRRADEAALAAIERDRARTRREDERAAALARRGTDHGRQASICAKLALRAKRAHEDVDTAGPRDQLRKGVLSHRADEDYAAACKKR